MHIAGLVGPIGWVTCGYGRLQSTAARFAVDAATASRLKIDPVFGSVVWPGLPGPP
jgi:hypothetical protein